MDADQFAALLTTFRTEQHTLIDAVTPQPPPRIQGIPQPVNTSAFLPPFENFNASKENFKIYKARFENYLTMKGVFADKTLCSQMLLNSIGSSHYQLIVSLV